MYKIDDNKDKLCDIVNTKQTTDIENTNINLRHGEVVIDSSNESPSSSAIGIIYNFDEDIPF